jgi:hypothetical protein
MGSSVVAQLYAINATMAGPKSLTCATFADLRHIIVFQLSTIKIGIPKYLALDEYFYGTGFVT